MSARHIFDLSGGQQQRVFLARALIAEPELLALDEPTTEVDVRTAENLLHLLARLNRQGTTILMTAHDLNAAAAHVPWVVCLTRRLLALGPPEEVFTEGILNETFQADMLVTRQDGMLSVQQKPHGHTRHELLLDAAYGTGDSRCQPAPTAHVITRHEASAHRCLFSCGPTSSNSFATARSPRCWWAPLGMIGVYIVLRGMSHIGHGVSHAILGGAVVSFVMAWNFCLGAGLWGFIPCTCTGNCQASNLRSEAANDSLSGSAVRIWT